tara:strand:+ start:318 stop:623 length:306 start_codon:yes stop_codon:yes gene_type:complete
MSTELEDLKKIIENLQNKVETLEKAQPKTKEVNITVPAEFMIEQIIIDEWANYKLNSGAGTGKKIDKDLVRWFKNGHTLNTNHPDYEEFLKSDFYKSRLSK